MRNSTVLRNEMLEKSNSYMNGASDNEQIPTNEPKKTKRKHNNNEENNNNQKNQNVQQVCIVVSGTTKTTTTAISDRNKTHIDWGTLNRDG